MTMMEHNTMSQINEDPAVLTFPEGIPGLTGCRRFVLGELVEDSAFQLLASLDMPEVSLLVGTPWSFFPDYEPQLSDAVQRELAIDDPEDAVVFCAASFDEEGHVFLNLLGPFVVNAQTRQGRQVVLEDDSLPLRAPVAMTVDA